MAHDPAVTRAAIEALRRDLRAHTAGRVTAPYEGDKGGAPGEAHAEGSPYEEEHESPDEAHAEGEVTCPECGHSFTPGAPPEHDGGAEHGGPEHGLLMLMPKEHGKK